MVGGSELVGPVKEMLEALRRVAPEAWEVAVQQQVVQGYAQLGGCLILLGVSLAAGYVARREWGDDTEVYNDGPVLVLSTIACLVALVVAVCLCFDGVMHLANPRYYAMMDLLGR